MFHTFPIKYLISSLNQYLLKVYHIPSTIATKYWSYKSKTDDPCCHGNSMLVRKTKTKQSKAALKILWKDEQGVMKINKATGRRGPLGSRAVGKGHFALWRGDVWTDTWQTRRSNHAKGWRRNNSGSQTSLWSPPQSTLRTLTSAPRKEGPMV